MVIYNDALAVHTFPRIQPWRSVERVKLGKKHNMLKMMWKCNKNQEVLSITTTVILVLIVTVMGEERSVQVLEAPKSPYLSYSVAEPATESPNPLLG